MRYQNKSVFKFTAVSKFKAWSPSDFKPLSGPPPHSPSLRYITSSRFTHQESVLWIRITLMQIRIWLTTLMRIWSGSEFGILYDADPDFLQIRLFILIRIRIQTLDKVLIGSYSIHYFDLSSANTSGCGSWSSLSLWCGSECGSGSGFLFDADPCGSGSTTLSRKNTLFSQSNL